MRRLVHAVLAGTDERRERERRRKEDTRIGGDEDADKQGD